MGSGKKGGAFLVSDLLVGDFRLRVSVKVTGGDAGLLFRAEAQPGGAVRGYRFGLGNGSWGVLSEAGGRGLLTKGTGADVKPGEWARCEIAATGSRIRAYVNGKLCADLDDAPGARRGVLALQAGSGEAHFKDLKLDLSSPK